MQFLKRDTRIDFLRWANPALVLSLVLCLLAVGALATRGLNFAVDFTGGLVMELRYPAPFALEQARATLTEAGYEASLQHFGSVRDVLVRLAPSERLTGAQLAEEVTAALRAVEPRVELLRQEYVGPQVGEELGERGGLSCSSPWAGCSSTSPCASSIG